MDLPPAWCQTCGCGRAFSTPQAYTNHERTCQKTKKRFSSALTKAKEVWASKKRRKTEAEPPAQELAGPSNLDIVPKPVPDAPFIEEVRFLPSMLLPSRNKQLFVRVVLARRQRSLTTWTKVSQTAETVEKIANCPNAIGTYHPILLHRYPRPHSPRPILPVTSSPHFRSCLLRQRAKGRLQCGLELQRS
jgi:hypothetical protein